MSEMSESTPVIYPYLSNLAVLCRQQKCTKTADLIDREHRALAERFGADRPQRWPTSAALRLVFEHVELRRAFAARNSDRQGEIVHVCALSVLTRLLDSEGAQLSPDVAQAIARRVEDDVRAALVRITESRNHELPVARMTIQNDLKFRARQAQEQQARERLAARARFAVAQARDAGADV